MEEFIYFNEEWNGKPKESYRLKIWDFKENGIEIYTLEEYNLKIKNKDADKHTK